MKRACIGLLIILFLPVGCAIHTVDIQQGNVITKEMVKQLKPGMSKRQVQFVLGTPTITDPFHPNQWDYIYTLQPGNERQITKRKHVRVFFDKDKVSKFDHTLGNLDTPEQES
ncbi:MAG: outer membrane protein assembly factor BamE [Gammaproteobacteria bacterium]|nr:outer membrane protein assembly factor BamE [Gammaproteobacteria bacterium]